MEKSDIINIAKTIDGAKKYVIQEFKGGTCLDPTLNNYDSYSREELIELAATCAQYVESCYVRGEQPADPKSPGENESPHTSDTRAPNKGENQ